MNWSWPASVQIAPNWNGRRDTTDVKIRIDMPLPMPRWVISSPSHITSAVPAVHVRMIRPALNAVKLWISIVPCRELRERLAEQAALAALHHEHERGRLHQRERDREVTRPLRDLLLPGLALVLPLLELRDHDAEQLHDDRRRDVRHDPEREHGRAGERAAREQVEEADRAGGARSSSAPVIAWKSTYGTGTCDPSRKMKMMKIVKKILFRRSGTRNMLRRRESPDMGLTTSCRRGAASVASGW